MMLLGPSYSAQILNPILFSAPPKATVNCGETRGTGSASGGGDQNRKFATPCDTGANAGGYTVSSIQIYTGAAAGKIYGAIYTDGGNNPASLVCSDTTGMTPTANQFNTITISGCGTLSANTQYFVSVDADSATTKYIYNATPCTGVTTGAASSYGTATQTAGTWSNPFGSVAGLGQCWSYYTVLIPQ